MYSFVSPTHRTWAEIRCDAILHNYNVIRSALAPDESFFAVVKANAYGHGAKDVAKILEGKADYLMVAEIAEALELRESGIASPILIAGYTDPVYAPLLVEKELTQCVFSLAYAKALCARLRSPARLKCHLKIDTGMGRLGLPSEEALLQEQAKELFRLPCLKWEGVFSHFAQSELPDDPYTALQRQRFSTALQILCSLGFSFRYRHLNNSAATLDGLETNTNASRVGLSLYGVYPSETIKEAWLRSDAHPPLQPAMKLKTRVACVRTLSPDESVGYNRRFLATEPTRVAVLSAGYADGLPRALSSAPAIAQGVRLVGSICMDMCFADLSKTSLDLKEADEVTLFGDAVSADQWAAHVHSIPYEIFCNLSARVPRIFL